MTKSSICENHFNPLVHQILSQLPNINEDDLKSLQKDFSKRNKMQTLPSKSQILSAYFDMVSSGEISENRDFEILLKKRAIRSMSGIVAVQVLTKPRPCPGNCIFCPNDPSMPKSYIKSEPGAMRAFLNDFDPVRQVQNRLQSLTITGHKPEKIEMIILGGCWDAYDKDYQDWFIEGVYRACNEFEMSVIARSEGNERRGNPNQKTKITQIDCHATPTASLAMTIMTNETAKHRIIGLTIETRPDLVNHENCKRRRDYGVTRIEMGIQSTDDEILKLNNRGHLMAETRQALHILRQWGFKISLHVMPGLHGSNEEKDLQTFISLFSDPYLKPDELKIYPTSVIPGTELYNLRKAGKYQPITTDQIKKLIKKIFRDIIPPYVRIKRLIRDIPATEIEAGSNITNLAQLIHEEMLREMCHSEGNEESSNGLKLDCHARNDIEVFYERLRKSDDLIETEIYDGIDCHASPIGFARNDIKSPRNFVSLDTRSREIRNKIKDNQTSENLLLVVRKYQSSVGSEFFISFEDELGYLYGFTRLLLPNLDIRKKTLDSRLSPAQNGDAIIRELHVYGVQELISKKSPLPPFNKRGSQHTGLGKKLLQFAEKKAKEIGFKRLSVISGVGVREYYRKLGYQLEGTYMVKKL